MDKSDYCERSQSQQLIGHTGRVIVKPVKCWNIKGGKPPPQPSKRCPAIWQSRSNGGEEQAEEQCGGPYKFRHHHHHHLAVAHQRRWRTSRRTVRLNTQDEVVEWRVWYLNRHQCHPQDKEDGEWGQAKEEIRVQLQTVKFLCDFWALKWWGTWKEWWAQWKIPEIKWILTLSFVFQRVSPSLKGQAH